MSSHGGKSYTEIYHQIQIVKQIGTPCIDQIN